MTLYLDADLFMALIKSSDHLKARAANFFREHTPSECVTSAMTLMEVWYYFQNNGLPHASESISAIHGLVGGVLPVHEATVEAALMLSEDARLSPSDAVHAALALSAGTIVSSDKSFDRVRGLKRIKL